MFLRLTILTALIALFGLSFSFLVQLPGRQGGGAFASTQSLDCAFGEAAVCRVQSGAGLF